MRKILLAYIPVLHRGYWQLFGKHPDADALYLLGEEITVNYEPLRKDIRALPSSLMRQAIESWHLFKAVHIAGFETLSQLKDEKPLIVMPDEDVCQQLAEGHLAGCHVLFESIFLRRDKKRSLAEVEIPCDEVIFADEFIASVMGLAWDLAQKSPDWWRQIGAVAVRGREILVAAYNRHVPTPNHVFAFGDPRSNFKKGLHFELSPALHPEAAIVSEAARRKDLCLEGADLYVTTFPCPPCAKLVAFAGFKRLYFMEGYAVFDGVDIIHSEGVKLIRVKI